MSGCVVSPDSGQAPRRAGAAADAGSEGALGLRLRHARGLQRLTLRSVADRVGCSESMLSKIERGRAAPSLEMLARLAEALGISMAALFPQEQRLPVVVHREGERQMISLGSKRNQADHTVLEPLIPHAEGRLLNANLHVVPPGGGSSGTLRHTGEEVGFVIAGFIELTVDGKAMLIGPGASFFFSSTLPHSYRNIGATPAQVIWVNSPPY